MSVAFQTDPVGHQKPSTKDALTVHQIECERRYGRINAALVEIDGKIDGLVRSVEGISHTNRRVNMIEKRMLRIETQTATAAGASKDNRALWINCLTLAAVSGTMIAAFLGLLP